MIHDICRTPRKTRCVAKLRSEKVKYNFSFFLSIHVLRCGAHSVSVFAEQFCSAACGSLGCQTDLGANLGERRPRESKVYRGRPGEWADVGHLDKDIMCHGSEKYIPWIRVE